MLFLHELANVVDAVEFHQGEQGVCLGKTAAAFVLVHGLDGTQIQVLAHLPDRKPSGLTEAAEISADDLPIVLFPIIHLHSLSFSDDAEHSVQFSRSLGSAPKETDI